MVNGRRGIATNPALRLCYYIVETEKFWPYRYMR